MSQYTISIKSIINIKSHLAPYNDDVFADTKKKIERGREIFFNFDYDGDDRFKRLFEEKFIIKNLTENICYNDVDLFLLALKNDVEIKAPMFYKKYKAIEDLKESELTNGGTIIRESNRDTKRDATDTRTDEAESQTESQTNASGKTKNSQFPQKVVASTSLNDINYMDSGNASENDSTAESSNTSTSSGTGKHNENGNDKFSEKVVNSISKFEHIEMFLNIQNDIITDFVNSFNNLFMQIW